MIVDFYDYIDELNSKDKEAMPEESVFWADTFREHRVYERQIELLEALAACYLSEKYGDNWIKYLNEAGELQGMTAQTLRNRSEYGQIAKKLVNGNYATWDDIIKCGATRLRKMRSLGILTEPDFLTAAAEFSASDWNKTIDELQGKEVDDLPKLPCPVCKTKVSAKVLEANGALHE